MGEPEFAELGAADVPEAEGLLDRVISGRMQVRLGEVVDVLDLPCRSARVDGRLVGVAAYAQGQDGRGELAALAVDSEQRGRGVGGRLLAEAVESIRRAGCNEVWLVTTNDNLTALRLYQRNGFHLAELRRDAVREARQRKPEIPELGEHGIPMRDELVLARRL